MDYNPASHRLTHPGAMLVPCSAGLVGQAQQQAEEAQREGAEAAAAAAKSQADLEDVSAAYNDLESHAFKLESDLRSTQQAGPASGALPPAPRPAVHSTGHGC